jgi:hypothetical protein
LPQLDSGARDRRTARGAVASRGMKMHGEVSIRFRS